jgi:hypothetical protein
MDNAQAVKVDIYRGYLASVPCPRCRVTALYHPEGTTDHIVCVSCNFTDSTVSGRREN